MLSLPSHPEPLRVLGIDPGSSSLGLSILEWDMNSSMFDVVHEQTFALTGRDYPIAAENHGQRLARHFDLEDQIHCFLWQYRPHVIASESPFMGQFAAAFKALSECLIILQRSMYVYSNHLPFHYYAPKQVKSAVGVVLTGNKGRKKEDNFNAVVGHPKLNWMVDPSQMSEHSIDATAVALTYLREHFPW